MSDVCDAQEIVAGRLCQALSNPVDVMAASLQPVKLGWSSGHFRRIGTVKVSSLEAIARVLNDTGVSFVIVGGLAVVAHGYGRQTAALDIVVRLDPETIRRAFQALATLGYRPRVPVTAAGFADPQQRAQWIVEKGMTVLNFHSDLHRETPIDVFVAEPFDFIEEYRQAMVQEIAPGVSVRVVRLETLLRLKESAARPQDLADIAELRLLNPEGQ